MNMLRTTLLMGLLTMLLLLAGGAIGGKNGMAMALVVAAVMNFVSYWFSDKIVLAMYGAREVSEAESPQLFGMVRQLALQAGLPMPRVYLMESETPNAFATGRNPDHAAVVATTGIIRILTREELMGVMAHELTHVRNRDILIGSIAATIAGAITYLAHMAQWSALFGGGRERDEESGGLMELIVMAVVAPLAALLIQMAISRSREYGADKGGAEISGNPLYLANALKKLEMANRQFPLFQATQATAHMFIVSPFSGGALSSLFSTHPPMAERVRRLEAMATGRRV